MEAEILRYCSTKMGQSREQRKHFRRIMKIGYFWLWRKIFTCLSRNWSINLWIRKKLSPAIWVASHSCFINAIWNIMGECIQTFLFLARQENGRFFYEYISFKLLNNKFIKLFQLPFISTFHALLFFHFNRKDNSLLTFESHKRKRGGTNRRKRVKRFR